MTDAQRWTALRQKLVKRLQTLRTTQDINVYFSAYTAVRIEEVKDVLIAMTKLGRVPLVAPHGGRMVAREGQMTLGELIEALRVHARNEPKKVVRYDFAHFRPKGIHSYRGYYEQLALGYTNEYRGGDDDEMTVEKLLALCKDANGRAFQGYKGGNFDMHDGTPMWVAAHNESGGTAIVAVRDDDWCLRLVTACVD